MGKSDSGIEQHVRHPRHGSSGSWWWR